MLLLMSFTSCIWYLYFYESPLLTSKPRRQTIWLSLLAIWPFEADQCGYEDILLIFIVYHIFTTIYINIEIRESLLDIFATYAFFILICKHLFFHSFQIFVEVSEIFFWAVQKHFREDSLILKFAIIFALRQFSKILLACDWFTTY